MALLFYKKEDLIFEEHPVNTRFKDLTGMKFSRLSVIGYAGRRKKTSRWYCECDCGKVIIASTGNLSNGHSSSCGCFKSERIVFLKQKHGHTKFKKVSNTYGLWCAMKARCCNPNVVHYMNYGGRGIAVCERWMDFENFLEDMGEKPEGMSIDRIDNNKGYYKENCRWATDKQQANNVRSNVILEYKGVRKTLSEWADEVLTPRTTIAYRIKKGWGVEKAISTPVRKQKNNKFKQI